MATQAVEEAPGVTERPRSMSEQHVDAAAGQVAMPENPYLSARKEWDERYGDVISRARNWRIAAVLALAVALAETGGMIALAMKTKVVPFVVAVDGLGRVVASGVAEHTSATDDRLKRAALVQWVTDLRTVTGDGVLQRKAIDRVYAMIARGTAAQNQVSDFYRGDPPQKRAQTQAVSVEVKAVYASTDATYEVEWVETTRGLVGEVQSEQRWKGSFTIAVNPPSDERLARVNPLGFYVTHLSWSRVL